MNGRKAERKPRREGTHVDSSQLPVDPVSGDPMPFSGTVGFCTQVVQINSPRLQHIHINKNQILRVEEIDRKLIDWGKDQQGRC